MSKIPRDDIPPPFSVLDYEVIVGFSVLGPRLGFYYYDVLDRWGGLNRLLF